MHHGEQTVAVLETQPRSRIQLSGVSSVWCTSTAPALARPVDRRRATFPHVLLDGLLQTKKKKKSNGGYTGTAMATVVEG